MKTKKEIELVNFEEREKKQIENCLEKIANYKKIDINSDKDVNLDEIYKVLEKKINDELYRLDDKEFINIVDKEIDQVIDNVDTKIDFEIGTEINWVIGKVIDRVIDKEFDRESDEEIDIEKFVKEVSEKLMNPDRQPSIVRNVNDLMLNKFEELADQFIKEASEEVQNKIISQFDYLKINDISMENKKKSLLQGIVERIESKKESLLQKLAEQMAITMEKKKEKALQRNQIKLLMPSIQERLHRATQIEQQRNQEATQNERQKTTKLEEIRE